MNPKKVTPAKGPERVIQDALIDFLTLRGWYVKETHGNMFQSGFPDLYCTHFTHGSRWIEVKLPGMVGSRWQQAQYECFPKMVANGSRIWILTAATETEYKKLWLPCNLHVYMKG